MTSIVELGTLEARGLECVRGRRRLFSNLSFSLGPGDCFELTGPNGSGKTSLLRMLCGLLPPTNGAILWHGEPITSLRGAYLSSVTYVGHRSAVKDELTTLENLRVSSALSGFELTGEQARDVLARLGLNAQEDVQARHLSEGQHRKLALARLVACRSSLWLLDEVLTSLDQAAAGAITSIIDDHVAGGGMALIATHHALKLATRRSRRIELAA
jgi:heme exporter protein A